MRQTTRLVDRRRAAQIHFLILIFIPPASKLNPSQNQKALSQLKLTPKARQKSQKAKLTNK